MRRLRKFEFSVDVFANSNYQNPFSFLSNSEVGRIKKPPTHAIASVAKILELISK